jgi:hypothetical protein
MNCGCQWRAFNNERRLMGVHDKSMERKFTLTNDKDGISPLAMLKISVLPGAILPN